MASPWRLSAIVLALLAVLAACAPSPLPAAPLPPPRYPAETRARLLRILDGEWREWGTQLRDARVQAPADPPPGAITEQDTAAFSKVLAYWSAVDRHDFIDRSKRSFVLADNTPCTAGELAAGGRAVQWGCQPWSAAFLSFALRAAGVDRAEFPPAIAHWIYVDALIRAGDRWGGAATFLGHEVAERAPVPGDIVCFARGIAGPASLAQRRAELGTPRPMHCDVVIAVAPGEILALGGNLADAVTAMRYATDSAGRLLRNVRPWFAVFENRMGFMP